MTMTVKEMLEKQLAKKKAEREERVKAQEASRPARLKAYLEKKHPPEDLEAKRRAWLKEYFKKK